MEFFKDLDEATLRLGVFAAIFAAMALAEAVVPRRSLLFQRPRRWFANLGLAVLDSLLVRLAFPLVAITAAVTAQENGWGLFALTAWPGWLEFVLAVLALDLAIYGQHVATHKVPALWRLHQVHHADRDIDVTTGIRFHPIEIALSMVWKIAVVTALGASPAAVLIFEIILNGMAMFSHANFDLGRRIDAALRLVLVTPDMHRVHHSVLREETDSNYGFNLSLWDRLFKTYRPQPRLGHIDMTIGLQPYQDDNPTRLAWALALPFRRLPEDDARPVRRPAA